MAYRNEFFEITKEDLGCRANDILQKKPLSKEIYSKLGDPQGILTTIGRKLLPHKLAVIIMYYRDSELSSLYAKNIIEFKGTLNKETYEQDAMKIRDKYNSIITFYSNEYEQLS